MSCLKVNSVHVVPEAEGISLLYEQAIMQVLVIA